LDTPNSLSGDFALQKGGVSQEYFVYFKKRQRSCRAKDPQDVGGV